MQMLFGPKHLLMMSVNGEICLAGVWYLDILAHTNKLLVRFFFFSCLEFFN